MSIPKINMTSQINKQKIKQIIMKDPDKYSRTIEMFADKDTFKRTIKKFENHDSSNMRQVISERYWEISRLMKQQNLSEDNLEKTALYMEIIADYIKNVNLKRF